MRFSSTTVAVALAATSVSAAVPNIKDANKNILKGAYIVQFADEKVIALPIGLENGLR